MATITTTAPALPVLLTVDDVAVETPVKSVQIIAVPASPDAELFENAAAAWNIYLVAGEATRFLGNVHEVRLAPYTREFVGQFLDEEEQDLFISGIVRRRDAAARSVARHYFSRIWAYARQFEAQERRDALAKPAGPCQIHECGARVGTAHILLDGRVLDACRNCREDYGLEVAPAA